MTMQTANVVNDVAYLATMTYAETRAAAFNPDRSFLFDLEGPLYEMEALSTTLEALLLDVVNEMRTHDRGRAAAIDYAACTLRQHIRDIAYSYDRLSGREEVEEAAPQRDVRGRFLKRAA